MINREIGNKVLQYAGQYPVITITGPRQSGKTTLCRMLFPDMPYANLEGIEERNFAVSDPKGFLARFTFRDSKGNEVDVIMDYGNNVRAIEIKSGQTINQSFFKGLKYFHNLSKQGNRLLIYGGAENRKQEGVDVLGWRDIAILEVE